MSKYGYSIDGINFDTGSKTKIVDLVLMGKLNPDSRIQDLNTMLWTRIRDHQELMQEIEKPAINLNFNEPNIDHYLAYGTESLYYNVPLKTFVIMTILSGGLFFLYWLYRNWVYIDSKKKRGKRSSSHLFFFFWAIFYISELLNNIERDPELKKAGIRSFGSRSVLTKLWMGFVLSILVGMIPLPTPSFIQSDLIFSMFLLWTLYPVQKYIYLTNTKLGFSYSNTGLGYYGIWILLILQFIIRIILIFRMR